MPALYGPSTRAAKTGNQGLEREFGTSAETFGGALDRGAFGKGPQLPFILSLIL